ncbi:MAG: VWA domain-containing protein [Oscillospiraceae bacterium]|nr:VWA domain-containing protein [Oscillospiraceae bacterium]
MIALSALSATKEVIGFSYIPTDTVLVLDMSNSMSDEDLVRMTKAANAAIRTLYETSNYNRVGVVTYNGYMNTLLAVDRYTTTSNSRDYPYLTINGRTISVRNGVSNSTADRKD